MHIMLINLLIAQHVRTNGTSDEASNRSQSSTTELVTKHRTTSASNKGGT
jgi:hypothetical protein